MPVAMPKSLALGRSIEVSILVVSTSVTPSLDQALRAVSEIGSGAAHDEGTDTIMAV